MITTIAVSLAAAMCFGVASVVQYEAVGRARSRFAAGPGLLIEVVYQRGWWIGAVIELTGVGLHLCAVSLGSLSVVQPVLTVGLAVALGVQRLIGRSVPAGAGFGTASVIAGLVVFLEGTSRQRAEVTAAPGSPLAGVLIVGAALLVTVVAGLRNRGGGVRSVALGAAAGMLMATSAATGKAWVLILRSEGLSALLSSWQLWTALALGAAGLVVSQAAFRAGDLAGPLAAMMAADPVVGVILGVVVFDEPLASGPAMAGQLAGLGIALLGVVVLARVQGSVTSQGPPPCHRCLAHPPFRWASRLEAP